MRELFAILALSAALPSVGVSPTSAASPVSMSWRAGTSDALADDAVILTKGGGMGGSARPQGGMNGEGGGMGCGSLCGGGGMGGRGGSSTGNGGGGGINGSGDGAGGVLQLFGPRKNCPRHRRKGQSDECRDDE